MPYSQRQKQDHETYHSSVTCFFRVWWMIRINVEKVLFKICFEDIKKDGVGKEKES